MLDIMREEDIVSLGKQILLDLPKRIKAMNAK